MELTNLTFPKTEQEQLKLLNCLFTDWYDEAKNKIFHDGRTADDIVFDGFYPFFSQQKIKVLFIGRESLGLTGDHYLNLLHYLYTQNQKIGSKSLNQAQFHARMFQLAYALNNPNCSWNDIPSAQDIAKTFATSSGISFAFMNLSKLSNESEEWVVDWKLVDSFTSAFKDCETNLFNKEIEIINPDIIISMNLERRLASLGELGVINYGNKASYFRLTCGNRKILLMDLFHFSAINKSSEEDFYMPVLQGIKDHY
tara:strand:- start:5166 stop:5930 length:765 start_codon:yes stop_codon:yes gene_type:complete